MSKFTTTGVELISAERIRQVTEKGYDSRHDDQHADGSLANFAAAIASFDAATMPPLIVRVTTRMRESLVCSRASRSATQADGDASLHRHHSQSESVWASTESMHDSNASLGGS